MNEASVAFLMKLLSAPGPSGFEKEAVQVWRSEATGLGLGVEGDVTGNSYAYLGPENAPTVMLAGHIDEIGLMVTHIEKEGQIYISGIGGWDPQVLVGQRVVVLAEKGKIPGVIGRKAIHLIKPEERDKASKMQELWIDIGASSRDEVEGAGVRIGDAAVLDTTPVRLLGDRIASRSIDNRIGSFVVLEALRLLKEAKETLSVRVVAVATAQEEIGNFPGARTAAYRVNPAVAIAVDVTHATDIPGVDKREIGERSLGSGPALTRGSVNHPMVFDDLRRAAEQHKMPYSVSAKPRSTSTDADGIHLSRAGVATALVSVPNRYMHSPSEIVSLSDLEKAAELLATYLVHLRPGRVEEYSHRY